jgi:hypothetical protein
MPQLAIPPAGIQLLGAEDPLVRMPHGLTVPAAMGLTLSDSLIEDMIKSVRSGKDLSLELGHKPVSGYLSMLGTMSGGALT